MGPGPRWIALVWRLPSGSSTPRVTIWRSLKRLGAARLTPGATLMPFREELFEQLGWIAQEIEELGGDAWVLPVMELSEREEANIRRQVNEERKAEYRALTDAGRLVERIPSPRDLRALHQRLTQIRSRDYFGAPGRAAAQRALGVPTSQGTKVETHAIRD